MAVEYQGFWASFGDLIWWFISAFVFIAYLFVLFSIIMDVFRDHKLNGWFKALWMIFLVFVPFLTAIVYLIARGRSMNERAMARAQQNEQAFSQYVRQTAGAGTSTADELSKLADLRDRGTISDEEFQHAKAKLLGKQPEPVAPATPTA